MEVMEGYEEVVSDPDDGAPWRFALLHITHGVCAVPGDNLIGMLEIGVY